MKVTQSCLTLCDPTDSTVHGILQARILEWVAFPFPRGIFPTQELNPGFLHCRRILYQLSHRESPGILEWVAHPFSGGSSWPRNQTGVSCITGGFFTSWATREALHHHRGTFLFTYRNSACKLPCLLHCTSCLLWLSNEIGIWKCPTDLEDFYSSVELGPYWRKNEILLHFLSCTHSSLASFPFS